MKKTITLLMTALALLAVSCAKIPTTRAVAIQLVFDGKNFAQENATVTVSALGTEFEGVTDENGVANFILPFGIFDAKASFRASDGTSVSNYNGTVSFEVAAIESADEEVPVIEVLLPLSNSVVSALIIKEIYTGGCQNNDNSKEYSYDRYVIVYNNSPDPVDASKLAFGMVGPMAASGKNAYRNAETGVFSYEAAGWLPCLYSFWWFADGKQVTIEPYSQISVAITGAVDHTVTYTNSVDLSNVDFAMYHPESGFNQAVSYPAPAFSDETRYMRTKVFGMGVAWPLHKDQPGLVLFMQGDKTALQLSEDTEAMDHVLGTSAAFNTVKLPMSQILDVADVWAPGNVATSQPRYPSSLNTGYIAYTTKLGYSIYRNVDKAATEALPENKGKLVYEYAGGTEGSSDPSGIDAEASIANGAHIVYSDTNDMSKDFHQRKVASLKK